MPSRSVSTQRAVNIQLGKISTPRLNRHSTCGNQVSLQRLLQCFRHADKPWANHKVVSSRSGPRRFVQRGDSGGGAPPGGVPLVALARSRRILKSFAPCSSVNGTNPNRRVSIICRACVEFPMLRRRVPADQGHPAKESAPHRSSLRNRRRPSRRLRVHPWFA